MAVYFVYRSPYEGPSGKHRKRFEEDDTVLDWFRNRWDYGAADPRARLREALGCDVYGLGTLFERVAEHDLPAPATDRQLDEYLQEYLYSEGPILYRPHLLTVKTDDDELELAYHFFDDHYLARHGRRAAFLLHEGWQLPGGHGKPGFRPSEPTTELKPAGKGEGATYLVFHAYYDSCNLIDLKGGYRIRGLRVPDLCRHLVRVTPGEGWPFELRLLRSQLLAEPKGVRAMERTFLQVVLEDPADDLPWLAYSDWLQDRGERPAGQLLLERALAGVTRYPVGPMTNHLSLSGFGRGSIPSAREELEGLAAQVGDSNSHDPKKSLVHVEDHLAQLCLHTARWGQTDLYHQWFLFDDLWAGAHADLANALLRYARTWDVLSPGRPAEED